MARPVGAEAETTRRRVLKAASLNVARKGVRGFSLREVARTAGVRPNTVSYYFGSKRALLSACLDESTVALLRPLAELLNLVAARAEKGRSRADIDRLLGELIALSFRTLRKHRATLRVLMQGVIATGELDPRWRDQSLKVFLDGVTQALGPVLRRSHGELRLDLQSIVMLAVRYALSSPKELAMLGGFASANESDVWPKIEGHLIRVGRRLLFED